MPKRPVSEAQEGVGWGEAGATMLGTKAPGGGGERFRLRCVRLTCNVSAPYKGSQGIYKTRAQNPGQLRALLKVTGRGLWLPGDRVLTVCEWDMRLDKRLGETHPCWAEGLGRGKRTTLPFCCCPKGISNHQSPDPLEPMGPSRVNGAQRWNCSV